MSGKFLYYLATIITLAFSCFWGGEMARADTQPEEDLSILEEVTSVSKLYDVQPTDWAFQALQSLVERYSCITGYPGGRYRGDHAMTRFEFAASLNFCLDRVTELISSSTANLVTRQDLTILQRLQEEFAAELVNIQGKINFLETRTAELEVNQFSTTTKISGFIFIGFDTVLSGGEDVVDSLNEKTLLFVSTSFTGRDLLITTLADSNVAFKNIAPFNNGTDVGPTREGTSIWVFGGPTNGTLFVPQIEYIFPLIDHEDEQFYITLAANFGFNTGRLFISNSLLSWEGYKINSGPVSTFGQLNPFYRLGGGQGAVVNYRRGPVLLTGVYLASQGASPQAGEGLFNGDYTAVGQVTWTPSSKFAMALSYGNSYFTPGRFAFNNEKKIDENSPGFVGSALANRFDNAGVFFDEDVPVLSNSYGIQAFYQIDPKLVLGAFATKIDARIIDRGNADIWSYALSITFPDLGKEGNVGGLIVGVEPTLTGLEIDGKAVGDFQRDTSFHIEAFYEHEVNDHISITPGVIWITAPNQDASNEDFVLGTIRTTFSF